MKNLEKNMKYVHIIKCAKVRALFAEYKVRFARAEQLCVKTAQRAKVISNSLLVVISFSLNARLGCSCGCALPTANVVICRQSIDADYLILFFNHVVTHGWLS